MRTGFANFATVACTTAALLAGGCSSLDGLVVASVDADGEVTAALLTATVTAGGLTRAIPVQRADHAAFMLPPAQTFAVKIPAKYAGTVTLAVDALDADMHVLASGTTTTTVASGKRTDVSLTLTKKPSLTIDPPSVTLTVGHMQTFTSNFPADWSVMEAGGGSITTDGVYTAPMTPGTYHVVAALTADPTITASATVDVSDRTVTLYAGHIGGSGNVDGTGTDARFGQAILGSIDGAGNVYFSDSYPNHTIRVLKSSTGEVKTIAGQPGARAFADGPGPDARFSIPYAPALDGAGNLFIPDSSNAIVRKLVVSTNVVSTIAGQYGQVIGHMDGTGSAARFGSPEAIVLDLGNIAFVGDNSASYTVRRIDLGSLAVTTLAGTPGNPGAMDGTGTAAKFSTIAGLASNRFDRIWVADSGNHAIREIVLATQAVTTIAGGLGTSGFMDATGTAARFNNPTSLFYDNNNGLYVTDAGNYAIRRVDTATRAVTTVAGGMAGSDDGTGTAAKFGGSLNGLVLDNTSLLIGDGTTVRRMVLASKAVTTVAGAAQVSGEIDGPFATAAFQYQSEMASDGAGNLYVYELGLDKIRKVSNGMVTTFAQGGEPGKLAFGGGKLYVTMGDGLHAIDPTSGADTIVAASGIGYPGALETDGTGHAWVATGNLILDVALPGGTVTTLAGGMTAGSADGTGTAASFSAPAGLAWDGAGALYVADSGNSVIRKIDLATKAVTTIAGLAGVNGTIDGTGAMARFDGPRKMLSDGNGNLLIIDHDSTVRKLVLATAAVSTYLGVPGHLGVRVGALPASLNSPRGLALGPAGELYVLNYNENCILVVK